MRDALAVHLAVILLSVVIVRILELESIREQHIAKSVHFQDSPAIVRVNIGD